jgi:hypothetical protein
MVRAGRETPVSDVYQYARFIRKGTLLDRDLVASLERREFGVIIVAFGLQAGKDEVRLERCFTGRVARTILENYQHVVTLELPGPEKFHFMIASTPGCHVRPENPPIRAIDSLIIG